MILDTEKKLKDVYDWLKDVKGAQPFTRSYEVYLGLDNRNLILVPKDSNHLVSKILPPIYISISDIEEILHKQK